MTIQQNRLLTFIRDYIQKNGYSPTLEEMAKSLGIKSPTVHEHLQNLIKGGYLTRDGYRRGYVLKNI